MPCKSRRMLRGAMYPIHLAVDGTADWLQTVTSPWHYPTLILFHLRASGCRVLCSAHLLPASPPGWASCCATSYFECQHVLTLKLSFVTTAFSCTTQHPTAFASHFSVFSSVCICKAFGRVEYGTNSSSYMLWISPCKNRSLHMSIGKHRSKVSSLLQLLISNYIQQQYHVRFTCHGGWWHVATVKLSLLYLPWWVVTCSNCQIVTTVPAMVGGDM